MVTSLKSEPQRDWSAWAKLRTEVNDAGSEQARVCAIRERERAVSLRACGQGGPRLSRQWAEGQVEAHTQVHCLEAVSQALPRVAVPG